MTEQPSQQSPPAGSQPSQQDDDALALIVATLLAGLGTKETIGVLTHILAGPLHIGVQAAQAAAVLALARPLRPRANVVTMQNLQVQSLPGEAPGPAEVLENAAAVQWRARYLIASARRIDDRMAGGQTQLQAVAAERQYLDLHVDAQRRRVEAARAVDAAAGLYGNELGWYADKDDRTTPECRWADGRNFYADRQPVFGWPGAVHPRCRCVAGPAFDGARLLYAAPVRLLRGH